VTARILSRVAGPESVPDETVAERIRRAARGVWATLVSDPLMPQPGFRGQAVADPRFLIYEAEGYRISLSVREQGGDGCDVLGQVIPLKEPALPATALVLISHRGILTTECPIGTEGEFAAYGLPGGDLRLEILLGETRILLNPPDKDGKF
jgi:hypothetical protein